MNSLEAALKKAGVGSSPPVRPIQPVVKRGGEIFVYFFHLNENIVNFETFAQNWQRIPEAASDSQSLALILHRTARHLKSCPNRALAAQCTKFAQEHISSWENAFFQLQSEFRPQHLSNSMWALGTLGIKPSAAFVTAWERQSLAKKTELDSQHVANSLWAFATLRICPSPELVAALDQQAQEIISQFKVQELTNTLWALATLGISPSADFTAAWERRAQGVMSELSPQDLSISIFSLAKLGIEPSHDFIKAWERQTLINLPKFCAQDLSNTLWAFATAGILPSASIIRAWERQAQAIMPTFTAQHLGTSLWSLATMNTTPLPQFVALWEQCALARMSEFSPQNLSNSLWAFATLGISPSKNLVMRWEQEAQSKISEFSAQDLSNSLWAHATLGIRPSESFLAGWAQQAREKLSYFSPQNLSNSLWSMAAIDSFGAANLRDTAQFFIENKGYEKRDQAAAFQIEHACLWFDLAVEITRGKENPTVSSYEGRLSDIFRAAGLEGRVFTVESLDHKVDMAFLGKQPILLELDGRQHFLDTNRVGAELAFNGNTRFQTALILKFAADAVLVRLPYTVSNEIFGIPPAGQIKAARTIYDLADSQKPGAYRVCCQSDQSLCLQPI